MNQPPVNPYQAPQQQQPAYTPNQQHYPQGMPESPFAPCPNCGARNAKAATFTWWGGVLGPKLFNHVNCLQCGAGYNGKTGESNNTKIAIYVIVLTLLSIGIVVAMSQ